MTPLNERSAQRALADATLALLAGCVAIAMFLPPLAQDTAASLPRTLAAALVALVALPLHWLCLDAAARRLGASRRGWVGLSMLLFPVGSAAALLLLSGLPSAAAARPSAAR